MTATERYSPLVFAVACVLVLLGGNRPALSDDLGAWNPSLSGVMGMDRADGTREVRFSFGVVGAVNDDSIVPEVCGTFWYSFSSRPSWSETSCVPKSVVNRGGGRFKATFVVPKRSGGHWIVSTEPSMKVRWHRAGTGWTAWSDPVSWDAVTHNLAVVPIN